MLKKFAATALICMIAFAAAACSSGKDAASENEAYIAARIAEEKVDGLFHQETSEDNKPILNPIAPDKEAAAKFLNAYVDPALTDKILAHYLTEEKAGDAIVVKADKYLSSSVRETTSKDDVTIDGSKKEYTVTTKDGGVYTLKKNDDGKYILSDYSKK